MTLPDFSDEEVMKIVDKIVIKIVKNFLSEFLAQQVVISKEQDIGN